MWPTVKESRFSKNWAEAWGDSIRDQMSGGTSGLERGERSAREVLAATDGDAYTPGERLRALADAVPSVRARIEKAAPTVKKRVGPARREPVKSSPAPVETKPAARVFDRPSWRALRHDPFFSYIPVAPDMFGDEPRGRIANNSAGVASSWVDADTRLRRMTRDRVEVTLPSGEVREYKSVREAFELLRLDVKKHIRFRIKLKETRAEAFAAHAFRLVPRS